MGVQLNEDRMYVLDIRASLASVAANTTAEQSLTVPGVRTGDTILNVTKGTPQAGLGIAGFRRAADDTVGVTLINATAAPIVPTATDLYRVTVLRYEKAYTAVPS